MFKLFTAHSDRAFVHLGRVACPTRVNEPEIDTCYACPSFLEIRKAAGETFVRCRSFRRIAMPLTMSL